MTEQELMALQVRASFYSTMNASIAILLFEYLSKDPAGRLEDGIETFRQWLRQRSSDLHQEIMTGLEQRKAQGTK